MASSDDQKWISNILKELNAESLNTSADGTVTSESEDKIVKDCFKLSEDEMKLIRNKLNDGFVLYEYGYNHSDVNEKTKHKLNSLWEAVKRFDDVNLKNWIEGHVKNSSDALKRDDPNFNEDEFLKNVSESVVFRFNTLEKYKDSDLFNSFKIYKDKEVSRDFAKNLFILNDDVVLVFGCSSFIDSNIIYSQYFVLEKPVTVAVTLEGETNPSLISTSTLISQDQVEINNENQQQYQQQIQYQQQLQQIQQQQLDQNNLLLNQQLNPQKQSPQQKPPKKVSNIVYMDDDEEDEDDDEDEGEPEDDYEDDYEEDDDSEDIEDASESDSEEENRRKSKRKVQTRSKAKPKTRATSKNKNQKKRKY